MFILQIQIELWKYIKQEPPPTFHIHHVHETDSYFIVRPYTQKTLH